MSQLTSLQCNQNQDNEERVSVGVQKKDEESDARVALYHEKIQLMVQTIEELKT